MAKPTSYSISLTFECQSAAAVLVRPPAVAGRVPWMGLSIFPSCWVLCCFLGIGSLGFSEFRHGTRKLYQVVDSRLFGKTFFAPKISRSGPKVKCFEFKEKSGHWFSLNLFIMKIYLLCSCTNLLSGKNFVPEI